MTAVRDAKPVVVGIDGSKAALRAAVWGAVEALEHDVALKLLCVIDCARAVTERVVGAQHLVADAALRDAYQAVEALQRPIKVELETICGDPGAVLTEQSRAAALLCVGAPKAHPRGPFDSLAGHMAEFACCTVAIVPETEAAIGQRGGRVVTVLDPSSIDYDVLQLAMEEAELRRLALYVLMTTAATAAADELLISWSQCYPHIDLHVQHAEQLPQYVEEHERSVKSVVLGAGQHSDVMRLVELIKSRAAVYNDFSVIVVRSEHL
ncbi:universal stress protein [Mycobacterium sp.]|uniref:universal stress protein n=1 Tax=Mycobacterium sp. TaxID=1785 RepID=UPI0025E8C741|nr:universal stress protein [Mycobacterium sp.]